MAVAAPPPAPEEINADLELRWTAPAEGCPDEAALLQELAAYRVGQATRDDRVLVEVVASQTDAAIWSAAVRLEIEGDVIERRFSAESCQVLASGVALLVAVAVDPGGMSEQVEPEEVAPAPVEPTPSEPPVEPPSEASTEPEPAPVSTPTPRIAIVGLRGGGSYGDLPGFGGAIEGAAGMKLAPLRFGLVGSYGFAREVLAPDRPFGSSAGADFDQWRVGVEVCYSIDPRRARFVQVPVCVESGGGQITARGKGLEINRIVRAPWADVGLSGGVILFPTRGFGFLLQAEGFVALTRPRFRIDELGELYRPAAVGARIWLGVEFHLGNNLWARRPNGE